MSSQTLFDLNTSILRAAFPATWSQIAAYMGGEEQDDALLKVETSRSGVPTLVVTKEGKGLFLHSRYDPQREAEAFANQFSAACQGTTVVFYGVGLGYQINAFLCNHPGVNYYIYEPIPELLKAYLNHQSLNDLPGKKLQGVIIGRHDQETVSFLQSVIDKSRGELLLVELPMHKQIFAAEYEKFLDLFQKTIKGKRTQLHTNYAYQKRWIINSMKNFKEVLSTPNIVMAGNRRFKGKPALLVAAGPSLNEEIENIRSIKEKGLAYIFTVGSAINTLIHYHVYPHAACTYDPSERNQIVFEKIKAEGIKEIPLIFGSSTGYETLQHYPGEMYHMITSQDLVANYFLKTTEEERLEIVSDAPTIALVTLQLLYTLGFNPIILVGQNLAYQGRSQHAEGIHYTTQVTTEEMERGIFVPDVYGNEVLTHVSMDLMRKQMEFYIKNFTDCTVLNTTKGGAQIEGANFLELEKVISTYLKDQVYNETWRSELKTDYDLAHLNVQLESMDRSYQRAQRLSDEYNDILKTIDRLITNRNFQEAEKMYVKLDKTLGKIERNKFFAIFILPMNRVQYKILIDSIDRLNEEQNPTTKGQRIVKSFKTFIDLCQEDLQLIAPLYQELKEEIYSYKG